MQCDPSHRRSSSTDMSRASASSIAKTSSAVPAGPSPQHESSWSYAPSLTRRSTQASRNAFTPSGAIDDFVLFPEDASWNPDMAQAGLEQFDFSDLDLTNNDFPICQNFESSFGQQPFIGSFNIPQQLGQSSHSQSPNLGHSSAPFVTFPGSVPGDHFDLNQLLHPGAFGPVHAHLKPAGNCQDSGPGGAGLEPRSTILPGMNSDWSFLETTLHGSNEFSADLLAPTRSDSASGGSSQQRIPWNQQDMNVQSQSHLTTPAVKASLGSSYDGGSNITIDPWDILDVRLSSTKSATLEKVRRQVTESLLTTQPCRNEHIAADKECFDRPNPIVESLGSGEIMIAGSALAKVRDYHAPLQTLCTRPGDSRSSDSLLDTLNANIRLNLLRQCQAGGRRMVRSLCCVPIKTVKAQKFATSNSAMAYRCNLCPLMPPYTREMQQASLVSGVGVWIDSTTDSQIGPSVLDVTSDSVLDDKVTAQSIQFLSNLNRTSALRAPLAGPAFRDHSEAPCLEVFSEHDEIRRPQTDLNQDHRQLSATFGQDTQLMAAKECMVGRKALGRSARGIQVGGTEDRPCVLSNLGTSSSCNTVSSLPFIGALAVFVSLVLCSKVNYLSPVYLHSLFSS